MHGIGNLRALTEPVILVSNRIVGARPVSSKSPWIG